MTILIGILKAAAIPAILALVVILRNMVDNRRCMRCDACRLERQEGRLFALLPHSCSTDRGLYRSQDGSEARQFGRTMPVAGNPPRAVVTGKGREKAPFKRQARKVVSIGQR